MRATLFVPVLLAAALAPLTTSAQDRKAGDFTVTPSEITRGGRTFPVDLGSVWVPMNRNKPDSPLIELKFVRVHSTARKPLPPIVYLAGGPGGSGIGTLRSGRFDSMAPLLEYADIIGWDQRGTGDSEPTNMIVGSPSRMPLDKAGDPAVYVEVFRDRARATAATMKKRGIDLDGFTTEESADDLMALRKALGVDTLTLWGSSYGTHLALATVRRHPDHVAGIILAGTEGPDHSFKLPSNIQRNLERLNALVAADSVYSSILPDFQGTLIEILAQLEKEPVIVDVLPGTPVVIGKWDVQKYMAGGMGSRTAMSRMPALVYSMNGGEFWDVARWAFGFRSSGRNSGMSMAMDCASWATARRLEQIEREAGETVLGATIDFPYPGWCEDTGLARLGDDFRAPVVSEVPALFISGTLDGRTPVSNAEEIAEGFKNSQHMVIEGASHGQDLFGSSPLIVEAVVDFIHGRTIATDRIEGPTWRFSPPVKKSLEAEMLRTLTTENYEGMVKRYRQIRQAHADDSTYNFAESVLNSLGYDLMGAGMSLQALSILRLNTVAYPEAANTWDSLAEIHMNMGDNKKAIEYYEKSLELNPDNTNAVGMLEKIRSGGN